MVVRFPSDIYLFKQGTRAKEACIVWFASLGYSEAFDFWQWGGSSWNVEFKNEYPLAPINVCCQEICL